eukprot:757139-Hanusia_phi.AAC.2
MVCQVSCMPSAYKSAQELRTSAGMYTPGATCSLRSHPSWTFVPPSHLLLHCVLDEIISGQVDGGEGHQPRNPCDTPSKESPADREDQE